MKEFNPVFSHWNISGQDHLLIEWRNQFGDVLYRIHSLDGFIHYQNTGRKDNVCKRYLSKYLKKFLVQK
jgi:hypothetical protein